MRIQKARHRRQKQRAARRDIPPLRDCLHPVAVCRLRHGKQALGKAVGLRFLLRNRRGVFALQKGAHPSAGRGQIRFGKGLRGPGRSPDKGRRFHLVREVPDGKADVVLPHGGKPLRRVLIIHLAVAAFFRKPALGDEDGKPVFDPLREFVEQDIVVRSRVKVQGVHDILIGKRIRKRAA